MVLAIVLLLLVPTLLYLQQITPLYTASAEVLIEGSDTGDTLLDRNNPYRPRLSEVAIMTESEVLTSTPLAWRVIEKLGLQNDPEYNPRLRKPSAFGMFMADLWALEWLPEEWRPARPVATVPELSPDARERIEKSRIVRRFLGLVDVRASRRTYVITVSATSDSREKAARVANMIVEFYILDRLELGFRKPAALPAGYPNGSKDCGAMLPPPRRQPSSIG
ncbi:hypothetical protein [Elstera litoralis]|uniref:hypothetical protein n=1 Tax=Elstera litoralis TaxID=552518 RepID=UPI001E5228F4|nr:hypothetical protein [Elstera litoralis]